MHKMPTLATLLALAFAASACSGDPQAADDAAVNAGAPATAGNVQPAATEAAVPNSPPGAADAGESVNLGSTTSLGETAGSDILALEGFAGLTIGEPVPKNSSWAERGAQIGETCRTVTSPRYPGAYAILLDGKVQRITLGQRSQAKLAEGIGVGAREKDVRQWFAGFREEPHNYEEAPAKYLTAPNAANGSSALRFEFGRDGRVKMIHVGLMPVLAYVEGCA